MQILIRHIAGKIKYFMRMKNIVGYTHAIISATCLLCFIHACNDNGAVKKAVANPVKSITSAKFLRKPPASYTDTLIINFPAAVFYQPDSIQLSLIKAQTDSMSFDGNMHEYFYQMRNARIVLKKTWPGLTIIESTKNRFLLFIKKNNTPECIDLDTKNESHGLFVFDGKKTPLPVDMTNIETEISFYLKN